MTDINDIIAGVLDVAEKVAPLIHPAAPAAIEAGKSLIELIGKVKAAAAETDQAKLSDQLAALEARVFAHADQTATNLRR